MLAGDTSTAPDPKNLQSLILHGARQSHSCHLLFNITNPDQVKGFFRALFKNPFYRMPLVQSAEEWGTDKPTVWVNVGLSHNGILKLRSAALTAGFPPEFIAGPWSSDSQASLGDGDPNQWWFGNFHSRDVDCTVHAFARTPHALTSLTNYLVTAATENGMLELTPLSRNSTQPRLVQSKLPDHRIHFGYRDGIGEPLLDWSSSTPASGDLNNFVIGYPAGMDFPPSPTTGQAGAFAKDGCYMAFTVLYQDVAAFNQFLATQAVELAPKLGFTPKATQEWLAARLMGRWRDGTPLIESPDQPQHAMCNDDDYKYGLADDIKYIQSSLRCPISAHGRVANSRDQILEPFHEPLPRLIRRGAPYGPYLASTTDDGIDRGLIGLFLCGSLSRQFEKMRGWMNMNDFSPVFTSDASSSQDALMGNRQIPASTSFRIPLPDGDIILRNLPRFVTTRGCAYLLMPSINTLAVLSGD